jgi:hypothetical protein
MLAVAAAGLTQPCAVVTLAEATLREDEGAGQKFFLENVNLCSPSHFLKVRSGKVAA